MCLEWFGLGNNEPILNILQFTFFHCQKIFWMEVKNQSYQFLQVFLRHCKQCRLDFLAKQFSLEALKLRMFLLTVSQRKYLVNETVRITVLLRKCIPLAVNDMCM